MSPPLLPNYLDTESVHLLYIALGGFITLFAFSSYAIKERLFLSEAFVATLFGILLGPLVSKLTSPSLFQGNINSFTLEFCRIIVGLQCFAAGVQSPGKFVKTEYKSLLILLGPVMVFMWIMSTVIVKLVLGLPWKDSMVIAGCVTPTDPVLANSIIKGAFAERHIPLALRHLISAESGLNDGLGLLLLYIPFYFNENSSIATGIGYWILNILLYQVLLAVLIGILLGYGFRKVVQVAHDRNWIDKESFLALSVSMALFIIGCFSRIGIDDVLGCFVAGCAASWDLWLNNQLEDTHIQEVLDYLLNSSFFILVGARLEWSLFSVEIDAWRIILCCLLVIVFRRVPAVLALKKFIPIVKTWQEAFFCGWFGPIGAGCIFYAMIAISMGIDQEPLFLIVGSIVLSSILFHGGSVGLFHLRLEKKKQASELTIVAL